SRHAGFHAAIHRTQINRSRGGLYAHRPIHGAGRHRARGATHEHLPRNRADVHLHAGWDAYEIIHGGTAAIQVHAAEVAATPVRRRRVTARVTHAALAVHAADNDAVAKVAPLEADVTPVSAPAQSGRDRDVGGGAGVHGDPPLQIAQMQPAARGHG